MPEKMLVIGLDCAEPSLVFDRFQSELPNLSGLVDRGLAGPLASVVPAITVPAWACGLAGKDPGQLGIYGFRNRKDYSYDGLSIANSTALKTPLAPDLLARRGKKIIMQGGVAEKMTYERISIKLTKNYSYLREAPDAEAIRKMCRFR